MTEATDNYSNGHEGKLDILIDQVGRLTEGLTEIKTLIAEQNEISKRQAETAAQQAQAAAQQAQTVDRLVGIVGRLIEERQITE